MLENKSSSSTKITPGVSRADLSSPNLNREHLNVKTTESLHGFTYGGNEMKS